MASVACCSLISLMWIQPLLKESCSFIRWLRSLSSSVVVSANETKAGLQVAKSRGVKLGCIRPGQDTANKARCQQTDDAAEKLRGVLTPMV